MKAQSPIVEPIIGPASSPQSLRYAARGGLPLMTSGLAPNYLQGNLVVLPKLWADEFVEFCRRNPAPLPLLAVGRPGDPTFPALGDAIDIRSDLGGYQVWRDGVVQAEVSDIRTFWRDDDVALVLGCWFSQEAALTAAGVRLRHIELGIQGGLFRTNLACTATEHFSGPDVVSARPFLNADVETVVRYTSQLPQGHGAPLHRGDAAALGIADIAQPDFGEPLAPMPGETMLYWGCGLTATEALRRAGIERFATQKPGCMLVTDLRAT